MGIELLLFQHKPASHYYLENPVCMGIVTLKPSCIPQWAFQTLLEKNGSTTTKILHCFKVKQKVRIALKPYSDDHTFIDNTIHCFSLSFIFVQVQLKVKTK